MEEYKIIKTLIYDYTTEIYELRKEIAKNEMNRTNELFQILRNYLESEGMTEKLSEILTPYIETIGQLDEVKITEEPEIIQINEDEKPDIPENNEEGLIENFHFLIEKKKVNNYKPATKNIIAYYKLIDGHEKVCLPNGSCYLLSKLDDKTYLQDGQFILVDSGTLSLIWSYKYVHVESLDSVVEFLTITFINGQIKTLNADNEIVDIEIPKYLALKEGQIISIDKKREFIRYYKPAKFIYENCKDSVHSRGFSVNTVDEILNEQIVLKNYETSEKTSIDYSISEALKYKIDETSIVITKDSEIVNVIQNKYFLPENLIIEQ